MRIAAGTGLAGIAEDVAVRAGRLQRGMVDRAFSGCRAEVFSGRLASHMGMTLGEGVGRNVVPGHVVHCQQTDHDRQYTCPQHQLLQASETGAMHKWRLAALARNTQGGYGNFDIGVPPWGIGRGDEMPTTEYQVKGMTCSHCEHAVSTEVGQIAGVEKVEVSAATGRLVVVSSAPVDTAEVVAAVEEAGYEAARTP